MDIEKIEKAFGLVLENIMAIQAELLTDFYDAFVEQNAAYLGALEFASLTKENNDKVRSMNLTKSEWQKLFQFVLLQGSRVAPMQANHNLTPDSIGFIFNFIIEELHKERKIRVLEFGSGTGNLAETLLIHMQKEVDYVGFEVDDLLLDLSASMSEVMGTEASFLQIDAVKPQPLESVDVVMSDLPVGYYPDDDTARHFQVHDKSEHTYVHHLMIEQSFKYLKESGFALFLAPDNLLTSAQSEFLKAWIKEHAHVAAVITLPSSLFKGAGKSIYLLSKNQTNTPTFVYPLADLADRSILQEFMSEFVKNVKI
ncbi:class I SAM-dependent methyltransferase [Lactococcus garvieae]|uniref:class I SAM-dependent methyltransferase n=1 Tax=Lactococcus garvieae TaxID=1363 RepID=UPI003852A69B